jgi:hypothetical protein
MVVVFVAVVYSCGGVVAATEVVEVAGVDALLGDGRLLLVVRHRIVVLLQPTKEKENEWSNNVELDDDAVTMTTTMDVDKVPEDDLARVETTFEFCHVGHGK